MGTVTEYLREIGARGGAAKTPRKVLTAKANLQKANAVRSAKAKAKRLAKVQESA